MKILIAEDDVTSRTILTAIVKKWGYEPVAVEDGSRAWQVMQDADAPDLAILDWVMPGMDGLQVCRLIRENLTFNPPYLILLTAKGEKSDIVTGLDAGASDYISKPYDNDELLARIRVGQRMVELQTELLETREALAHKATYDSLTGALNRGAILDGLRKALKRAERRNSNLSIGLCDIDHFKDINDTYGHQVGDDVLRGLVHTIHNNLRDHDLLGRYGGEEFLVVAPHSSGSSEAGLYERLRAQIAGLEVTTKSAVVGITVSIGVASAEQGTSVDLMLTEADNALYRAKAEGRNRVCYAMQGKVASGKGKGQAV
ncbi:MAG: diguanylate cyclase [Desulfohalobiaceae bacterium]|nr:diguanylate cyclase [Desulfohalobiaceae bacterium]